MNSKIIAGVVGAVVLAVVSFYGGMTYGKSSTPARGQFPNGQFMGGGPNDAGGTRGAMAGGGLIAGEIIAKDNSSITIKMPGGSTKIVLVSSSTQVLKSTEGSDADLIVGTNVTVTGSTNSDGSVTGQSVQMRPAGMGFPQQTGTPPR